MKNLDVKSSLFWLILSIVIMVESYRFDIGSFHNPGPGFLTFWTGSILGLLSVILLLKSWKTRSNEMELDFKKIMWKNVILVVASMFVYALLLEQLGFMLTTLLLIGFLLLAIESKKWYVVIAVAILTALMSYAIFELWLGSQLPKGIFRI